MVVPFSDSIPPLQAAVIDEAVQCVTPRQYLSYETSRDARIRNCDGRGVHIWDKE